MSSPVLRQTDHGRGQAAAPTIARILHKFIEIKMSYCGAQELSPPVIINTLFAIKNAAQKLFLIRPKVFLNPADKLNMQSEKRFVNSKKL